MMAADSLHVTVHLLVPSGVSIQWLFGCCRACSASASALHFALPSHVQASCLERARPAAIAAFAGALAARAVAPPGRRRPGRQRRAKAEGKTKGRGTGPRRKPVCTWGWRGDRANAGMPACFARPDTPELAGGTAMTDRRDDDFRVRPTFGVAGTLQQRSAELAIVLPGLATQAGKFIGRKHGFHLAPATLDERNHLIRVDHCFRP